VICVWASRDASENYIGDLTHCSNAWKYDREQPNRGGREAQDEC
jgi:hypothetical protein